MRVLFVSVPWPSHYQGLVPLAWALRVQGHDVRVASQPPLMDAVASSGLPAVRVGQLTDFMGAFRGNAIPLFSADYPKLSPEDGERVSQGFIQGFTRIAGDMLADLVELGRSWRPDLVVYEPMTFAAPIAAAVLGVPAVRVPWGVDITSLSANLEAPILRPLLDRYGLDTVETLGTLTVDPCPPSMQLESSRPRRTVRYIPYNGPGLTPADLLEPARRPRVCVTWGTTTVKLSGPEAFLLPYALSAIAARDVDVVVAIAEEQRPLLGAVPDGVRVVHRVPLQTLVPACDAIVHQGGSGTMLTAACYGVPQLIIPQVPDQVLNATRYAKTGAGLVSYPRGQLGPEALPHLGLALGKLLGELAEFTVAAQRLRAEIERQPTPAEIVPELADLARRPLPV